MSRYWGFECKTCNEDTETINHGDGILRDLAKIWPLLRVAIDAAGDAEGWLEIGLMGHSGIVSFLREHDGHDLWLWDEYHKEDAPLNIPPRTDDVVKNAYDRCGLSYDGLFALLRERDVEEVRIGAVMRDALTMISKFIEAQGREEPAP